MDMIGNVKRMHFRDHLSFSDIARRTGLSRNTVKKWAKAPAEVEPRYRREAGRRQAERLPRCTGAGAARRCAAPQA